MNKQSTQKSISPIIIIPVFNHAKTLRQVVKRALHQDVPVMVIDDGSTDGGAETITDLKVKVITHAQNLGKGAAIMKGALEARKMGKTHIVTIDADGQHDPDEYLKFSQTMMEHPDDILVGKRNFQTANVPRASIWGRSFSNFWFRLQTGYRLGDVQSGFRVYPVVIFHQLKLVEKRFSFEVEVLVKSSWAGIRIQDVDISVHYPPAKKRISHFNKIKDNLRLTHLNTKLTFRSLLPIPHRKIVPEMSASNISVLHPILSIKTLLKQNTSPSRIAASGALGVFLGTLPLIACHTLAILLISGYSRLNKIVALATSQICMPPFVPALCIEVGYFMRHGNFLTEFSLETIGHQGLERLLEWLLGSLIVAPLLAIIVGGAIFSGATLVNKLNIKQNG